LIKEREIATDFEKYWFNGEVIIKFQLTQARYGELREKQL
jgi:hypothetical protein